MPSWSLIKITCIKTGLSYWQPADCIQPTRINVWPTGSSCQSPHCFGCPDGSWGLWSRTAQTQKETWWVSCLHGNTNREKGRHLCYLVSSSRFWGREPENILHGAGSRGAAQRQQGGIAPMVVTAGGLHRGSRGPRQPDSLYCMQPSRHQWPMWGMRPPPGEDG